jgi:hypothetical protein
VVADVGVPVGYAVGCDVGPHDGLGVGLIEGPAEGEFVSGKVGEGVG